MERGSGGGEEFEDRWKKDGTRREGGEGIRGGGEEKP